MSWFTTREPNDDWIKCLFEPAYDLITMETDYTKRAKREREQRKEAKKRERELQLERLEEEERNRLEKERRRVEEEKQHQLESILPPLPYDLIEFEELDWVAKEYAKQKKQMP
ncbi:hypothetical protein SAMN04487866_1162 [Thermoactinomyces sp. DSM 45891]|uniref:hypothetical protein n=1 Tax=Thermoactinomyces sp. DSM 45891 TaxID=1761907 RepID=UPI0009115D9A|nr:hypothetical protein [Thermoactinomyces sp. DSM 45891]SFX65837.1 hypothetical protein SAMN04487866_1162 [Thermoactinomyces sp. DSM 45891]